MMGITFWNVSEFALVNVQALQPFFRETMSDASLQGSSDVESGEQSPQAGRASRIQSGQMVDASATFSSDRHSLRDETAWLAGALASFLTNCIDDTKGKGKGKVDSAEKEASDAIGQNNVEEVHQRASSLPKAKPKMSRPKKTLEKKK